MADSSPAAVQTAVAMPLLVDSPRVRVTAIAPRRVAGGPDQDGRRSRERVRS